MLREHRGDGHFAAVTTADIDGCEVLVLRCGLDMRREDLQPIRGWTDEQWDAARARLAARGWTGPDSASPPRAGPRTRPWNRSRTRPRPGRGPASARPPWLAWPGPHPDRAGLRQVVPYPSPIGVPAPGTVRTPLTR